MRRFSFEFQFEHDYSLNVRSRDSGMMEGVCERRVCGEGGIRIETFCETANFNSVGSPKMTCLGN
jgi:hypothetical protein